MVTPVIVLTVIAAAVVVAALASFEGATSSRPDQRSDSRTCAIAAVPASAARSRNDTIIANSSSV